ncbi:MULTISPECIES: hypothetical protein [Stenotrophomonas]|uniref:hypothetical protein n=1 Tax=Stenotrophomonas TaxID=40323 RepID=UPI000D53C544|nr:MULTISPECIES: hypothetical protein [Stenotrophomonas]AWH32968.1 hypothetical protein C1930_08910 [Stenotrophomonas sp. SAU14A_NAIMI4_8]
MPFVNEYISPEDAARYHLAEIDASFRSGGISRQWTIDREQDIYLRILSRGLEAETKHESVWSFYWKGTLLTLRLDLLNGNGKPGEPGWSHWLLVRLNGTNGLPPTLGPYKQSIKESLRQALVAYKDAGVLSGNTDYTITLDVSDECAL